MEIDLTLFQRFKLWLNGTVYLHHVKHVGWSAPLPFYAFKCPVHGIVSDYPHGWKKKLSCPYCKPKSTHPDLVPIVVEEVLDGPKPKMPQG